LSGVRGVSPFFDLETHSFSITKSEIKDDPQIPNFAIVYINFRLRQSKPILIRTIEESTANSSFDTPHILSRILKQAFFLLQQFDMSKPAKR